jgi:hypothetical protein
MLIAQFLSLWRSDPVLRRLFWLPTVLGLIAYVVLGILGWLAIAPVLEAWFGEWEIVGRFLALGLWVAVFQFVFVLLASVFAEAIHEPVAARIEFLRDGEIVAVRTGFGGWLLDSVVRVCVSAVLTLGSALAGAWMPWLAPIAVVFCSGWCAVAAGAGVCANRHGVRFARVFREILWPPDRRWWEAVLLCGLAGVFPMATAVVLPFATALGTLLYLERRQKPTAPPVAAE